MTKTTKTEVLATASTTGAYGFIRDARLVTRNAKTFLIYGSYCGDDINGYCYRDCIAVVDDLPEMQTWMKSEDIWKILDRFMESLPVRPMGLKSRFAWACDL